MKVVQKSNNPTDNTSLESLATLTTLATLYLLHLQSQFQFAAPLP